MRRPTWTPLLVLAAVMAVPTPATAQDYRALWAVGQTYGEFTADVQARRALWRRNTERATVPADLRERARTVPGEWRLLVVAFDGCSDSVSTIPYLAALADSVSGLEMRIIRPEAGRSVMAAYSTPDGRTATPTVVLLDAAGRPAGAWVERPSELQAWHAANPDGLSHDARYREKMAWYDRDAGASTVREVVALLERAAAR